MRQLKITKQVTNRETKSLNNYLADVSKIDLITAEEEVELAQRIKKGDDLALNKLTSANLRFVISVAKQYQNQGLSLSDLINEGNVGLVKAARRFDETRGFKFISYAVWWIRQSILQAISEHARTVRIPLNKIGELSKIKQARVDLEQRLEREPTAAEIAKVMDVAPDRIETTLHTTQRSRSIDAPLAEEESTFSLHNVLESNHAAHTDGSLMQESLEQEIDRTLETLTEREASVLRLNYGLNGNQQLSLSEIGELFDLTRERVRQIREKAIRRLRHTSKSKVLISYLG